MFIFPFFFFLVDMYCNKTIKCIRFWFVISCIVQINRKLWQNNFHFHSFFQQNNKFSIYFFFFVQPQSLNKHFQTHQKHIFHSYFISYYLCFHFHFSINKYLPTYGVFPKTNHKYNIRLHYKTTTTVKWNLIFSSSGPLFLALVRIEHMLLFG